MRTTTLRIWTVVTLLAGLLTPVLSHAGECITSDSDLLAAQKNFYADAKKNGLGDYEDGWGLSCWRSDEGLDKQLEQVLRDMMNDSSIHPAYVAESANDYFFFDLDQRLKELQESQGSARYALIRPLLKKPGAPEPLPPTPLGEGEIDYIDGPANIRDQPKGTQIATLPDNTRVRVYREQDGWVEIHAGKVRGWTFHKNLMGRLLGKQGPEAFPVLSRAAFMGYAETVDFLLAQGADPNEVDRFGRNALHWAVLGTSFDLGGVERRILRKLCSVKGIEVNRRDKEGQTPLFGAVKQMDLEVIKTLLGVPGVDATLADNRGNTPLGYAIGWKRRDILDALVAASPQLDINVADNDGETLLAHAISTNPKLVPELLKFKGIDLERADNKGRTPLFRAVELHETELVKLLLEQGARIETTDNEGNSLLHACFTNRDPYRRNQGQEIPLLLLADPRLDPDHANVHGTTPLHLAIRAGNLELVRQLVARPEVDVNRGGYLRMTMYYPHETKNAREMALLLLERDDLKVDMVVNDRGMTLAFFPSGYWQNAPYSLPLAEKVLARQPDLEVVSEFGETALTYNIKEGRVGMVKLLLAAGADTNHSNGGVYGFPSRTPLKYAETLGNPEIIALLKGANAQDYQLIGGAELSPEGIPQQLLKDDDANEAIRFYRRYLVDSTSKAIEQLEAGQMQEAIRGQEFILDEILMEVGASVPKFSAEQRKRAKQTFMTIRAYQREHPRDESAWFEQVEEERRQAYAEIDAQIDAVLDGDYDDAPDGELRDHTPMVPILILRDYMAHNSIAALKLVRAGQTQEAVDLLAAAVAKSELGAMPSR